MKTPNGRFQRLKLKLWRMFFEPRTRARHVIRKHQADIKKRWERVRLEPGTYERHEALSVFKMWEEEPVVFSMVDFHAMGGNRAFGNSNDTLLDGSNVHFSYGAPDRL